MPLPFRPRHRHCLVTEKAELVRNDKNTMLITRGGVEDTRLEAKAKDSPSEDRPSRAQGQECSRPRQGPTTQAQVFSK